MENRKRVLVVSGELIYIWMILLSINDLNGKTIEIVNHGLSKAVRSSEKALSLIEKHKPDVILLDHFLFRTPMNKIRGEILEDGEGIIIAQKIDFFYVGEIKPEIVSLSSRSKKEIGSLYGSRVRHYCEGDMLKLARCLKGECSC
ncbi:MAG: hypothetical protein HW401_324 [Parcubacteria group bacterium]|nr:hypothetical protein [Parcubacteria group bacterium]